MRVSSSRFDGDVRIFSPVIRHAVVLETRCFSQVDVDADAGLHPANQVGIDPLIPVWLQSIERAVCTGFHRCDRRPENRIAFGQDPAVIGRGAKSHVNDSPAQCIQELSLWNDFGATSKFNAHDALACLVDGIDVFQKQRREILLPVPAADQRKNFFLSRC